VIERRDELKNRVEAKQRELQARYLELKADTQERAREERDRVKRKLEELQEAIVEGWDNLTDRVAAKLNDWLKT
jgi:DNA anti-recombination protein RmuC